MKEPRGSSRVDPRLRNLVEKRKHLFNSSLAKNRFFLLDSMRFGKLLILVRIVGINRGEGEKNASKTALKLLERAVRRD